MDFNKLLVKDSSGVPSITMTAFCIGFGVVNLKLILSGVSLLNYKMAAFTGVEYAAALSALGGIYIIRRNFGVPKKEDKKDGKS